MEVNIIYENTQPMGEEPQSTPVGWEMKPTTDEEHRIAATIRNLQFFGVEGSAIKYNGLELIEPDKGKTTGNIKRLSWKTKESQQKFNL